MGVTGAHQQYNLMVELYVRRLRVYKWTIGMGRNQSWTTVVHRGPAAGEPVLMGPGPVLTGHRTAARCGPGRRPFFPPTGQC
ncbi:conserved hypothetical protein [Arthrobacter sp. 8AJ]|nr:conserved hypothetical protein [Arthrobacter sp. 8AJ]